MRHALTVFMCLRLPPGATQRVQVLKTVMTSIGDKLKEKEVNNMIKDAAECTDANGLIDYAAFARQLVHPSRHA